MGVSKSLPLGPFKFSSLSFSSTNHSLVLFDVLVDVFLSLLIHFALSKRSSLEANANLHKY